MKETNSQVKDYRAPCYLNDSCTPPYLCRTFSVVNIELRPAFFSGAWVLSKIKNEYRTWTIENLIQMSL